MGSRILARIVFALAAVAVSAAGVSAEVRLTVNRGDVDLRVRQASIREILEEWTRVAGTTFIGLGQLPSDVVTLDLRGVPERQALEILLRSASGYVIVPAEPGAQIQSQFRSVLVLTGSVAGQRREPSVAAMPRLAPAPVESAATESIEAPADASADDVIASGDDNTLNPVALSPLGADSSQSVVQGRTLPVRPDGLPEGIAPGEPIGDPFSRPGLIPAWLQDSRPAVPTGRVTAPSGSATPGAIGPAQMRAPGARDSMSERSPLPPPQAPPTLATEPSN